MTETSLETLRKVFVVFILCAMVTMAVRGTLKAQSTSGVVQGTVVDPSQAAVPRANVRLENRVSGHVSQVTTGANGTFSIPNIPFNLYHLTVTAPGFANHDEDVDVRASVPVTVMTIGLTLVGTSTNITVTGTATELLDVTSEEHTDVDRSLFQELPLESPSSSVSSLITLASPGVVADSNGLFHGLGDHAENSFAVDGQPITDQQSKVFSNQIPSDSIQSLEVIEGAPPAEYGGKTSVVVKVTTRSGLGEKTPHGEVTTSYGSFGTSTLNANARVRRREMGRILFPWADWTAAGSSILPNSWCCTIKGNEENYFDRFDFKPSDRDSIQLNLEYTRSWFQTPNSWDQQLQKCTVLSTMCNEAGTVAVNPITKSPLGPTDQRSQIRTFDVAPMWTRVIEFRRCIQLGRLDAARPI